MKTRIDPFTYARESGKIPVVRSYAALPDDGTWAIHHDSRGGTRMARRIDADRYMAILPFLYTHAIIVGRVGNEATYDDRWCYDDHPSAIAAATRWDGEGEPEGWHRHPSSGRRRPDGDPAREYVNL